MVLIFKRIGNDLKEIWNAQELPKELIYIKTYNTVQVMTTDLLECCPSCINTQNCVICSHQRARTNKQPVLTNINNIDNLNELLVIEENK